MYEILIFKKFSRGTITIYSLVFKPWMSLERMGIGMQPDWIAKFASQFVRPVLAMIDIQRTYHMFNSISNDLFY